MDDRVYLDVMRRIVDESELLSDWQVGKLMRDLMNNADSVGDVIVSFVGFAEPEWLLLLRELIGRLQGS